MGSYLSEPITEKISIDELNDKLSCGASSMQGWRLSQEDAHNCLLDFDENTSLFAVYDGHGGHEVAQYCSMKFPDFLKNMEAYKNGDYKKALEDAFLGFDATLATEDVITELKGLANDKEEDDEDSEVEENVNNLYEEASMPIEKVIEKYKNNLSAHVTDCEKKPSSPYLKAKASSSGLSEHVDGVSSSSSGNLEISCADSSSKPENGDEVSDATVPSSSGDHECPVTKGKDKKSDDGPQKNGEVLPSESADEDVTSSSCPLQNGDVSKKGKGKAPAKSRPPKLSKDRPKRSVRQIYAKLLDFNEESDDSEDEEDKTFEEPRGDSSDDEDDGVNVNIDGEEEEEDETSEEDDDSEDDDEEEDKTSLEFVKNMREEPGSDSGCTAVVALLKDCELYVANAGDSRCIVCRNGVAVDMSIDHKPEDELERARVVKAGGEVSLDGRVNGGLNLSRAFGDHAYKQNKELSDREQMITALPDIRTLTVNPNEDEFMVLACDGIWNYMSSQEVVDFVKQGLKQDKSLSKICEEMFDHCLAPNTLGDGTGCDNMTAIIIKFKSSGVKRSISPEPEELDNKRKKTESTSQEEKKSV